MVGLFTALLVFSIIPILFPPPWLWERERERGESIVWSNAMGTPNLHLKYILNEMEHLNWLSVRFIQSFQPIQIFHLIKCAFEIQIECTHRLCNELACLWIIFWADQKLPIWIDLVGFCMRSTSNLKETHHYLDWFFWKDRKWPIKCYIWGDKCCNLRERSCTYLYI